MGANKATGIDQGGAQVLLHHIDLWDDLVDGPDDEFREQDVPEHGHATFVKLSRYSSILNRRTENVDGADTREVYSFRPRMWGRIETALEERDEWCPCGHGGFQNHGDYYTCSYDGCDQQFARDELEVDS